MLPRVLSEVMDLPVDSRVQSALGAGTGPGDGDDTAYDAYRDFVTGGLWGRTIARLVFIGEGHKSRCSKEDGVFAMANCRHIVWAQPISSILLSQCAK